MDPQAGAVQALAWQLRQLRQRAGNPGYRALAKRVHFSASTLADAARGERLASLEVVLAYAEACGGDADEWRARWSAAAKARAAAGPKQSGQGDAAGAGEREECPYQGLTAFQAEEAARFFGRAELVERLVGRVEQLSFVALFGASGSGKSSLLRAGLLGSIAADPEAAGHWRTLLMTPTAHPIKELSDQVAKLCGADVHRMYEDLSQDPAALDLAIRGALAADPEVCRALLVVDQFEEAFTLCTDEGERARFIGMLLDVAHGPGRRTTVVLGVRADFLAHLTQHPGLAEALGEQAQLLVGPVSATGLREIIVGPAAHAGLRVEPELLVTVLADAAGEPGALPLVSHALLETWERRSANSLTLAGYQASGGVRGAIAQTAERVNDRLSPEQQQIARRIFLRLTALGEGTEDTRRPIVRTELDGVADPPVVAEVLDRLAEARLVVLGDGTVEVAHEALIRAWPRLHRWLTDDRANLLVHRGLTEAAHGWQSSDREAGALYRGGRLAAARAWAQEHPGNLNELENAFLAAGNAAERAEQDSARRRTRLLKGLVMGMALLMTLAMVSGFVAMSQRTDARRQQQITFADQLSLQARSLLATDPAMSGRLAVEAYRLNPDTETIGGLLSATAAPRPVVLNAGGPAVYSLAFSPDHSVLASAAVDGTISLWDPSRGALITTLDGRAGRVTTVAFSGDGNRLASLAIDGTAGTITVWDTHTHRQVRRLAIEHPAAAMAFSSDGTVIAAGTDTGGIALYDLTHTSDMPSATLRSHQHTVLSLAFSSDRQYLVSAAAQESPIVWNTDTGAGTTLRGADHVDSVAFEPSGHRLAAGADDRGVYLWLDGDLAAPATSLPLHGSFGWVISAPVNDKIAVADESGTVTLRDLRGIEPPQAFRDRGRVETLAVALSGDGSILASAGWDGGIVLHDLRNKPFGGFDAQVNDVEVSPDGRTIASAGSDGSVRLWDGAGKPLGVLGEQPDGVEAVAFGPDGRLLAAVSRNRTLKIWDTASRQPVAQPIRIPARGASTDVAFGAGGRYLAAATLGPYLWEVTHPESPVSVPLKSARLATALAFSPDGRRLLTTSVGGFVNVIDLATGDQADRFDTHQGVVQDLAVSPDGRILATAGDSRAIKLWDTVTHREIAVLSGHSAPIQVLAFSRDGRTLASAGDDHTVVTWEVGTGRRLATLTGHTGRVRGLSFTADGDLVSGGQDGRIIRWSLDPGRAMTRVCTAVGRSLNRDEWAAYLPSLPYRPTCDRFSGVTSR
ncbi:helix-turn-helix domain-containing protein [Streptomyces sp. ISL-44]|uniref:nSTAND1 domain-containing NTPase n=1 Tax=Streptomyces sp. ISL-44 TaxID=2819184 RepID=UPI001BE97A5C|nr:helix-turn-helix domain-containing protein [Streptomyces sp. ISL-44]MBT2545845.1 helix-turn-helix domain-containing protein [Streptomyces sp. ISL-44]